MKKHIIRGLNTQLKSKPDNKTEGYIYNKIYKGMKSAEHIDVTIHELMEFATNGGVFQVGKYSDNKPTPLELRDIKEAYEMNELEEVDRLKSVIANKGRSLTETTLIVIDVDNELGNVAPEELVNYIKPHAYYYTFSHGKLSDETGKEQNALRLIFELDKPASKEMALYIEKAITLEIKKKFPFIDNHGGEVAGTLTKTFVFGSRNENFKVYNRPPINVDSYEEEFTLEQDFKDLEAVTKIHNNTAFDGNELIDMAKFLADKNVYIDGDHKKWTGIAMGLFHSAKLGMISEELALQVVMCFDQHRHPESYYLTYKSDKEVANPATVGSFIKLAKDNGYKRKHTNKPEIKKEHKNLKKITIDSYLGIDQATEILNDKAKTVLVCSPTGSGKTYSFIESIKLYLKEHTDTACYFAMPTKALVSQAVETYDLGAGLMGKFSPKRCYEDAINKLGLPIVVGTYDKAKIFSDHLKHKKLIIVADEAHKEVLDYSYRPQAINGLFNLRTASNVIKFIGLSGTPQEIDLTRYESVVEVNSSIKRSVFNDLDIATYGESYLFEESTTRLISREVKAGNKVLAFINNKRIIKNIQGVLSNVGIKSVAISSRENLSQSKTYRYIMEHEKLPDDAQVLLATTVISDGINIKNDSENYVCVVAPHYQKSPLFNASTIKQASNRFRNTYKKLIIPYFISKPTQDDKDRQNETKLFNFEWKYNNLLETAKGIASYTEARFRNSLGEYNPSILEVLAGMYFQNPYLKDNFNKKELERALQEERKKNARFPNYDKELVKKLDAFRSKLFDVDSRVIRQRTSEAQEKYYQYYPYAFLKNLETTLEVSPCIEGLELYLNSKEDKKLIKSLYEEIKRAEDLEDRDKEENLATLLTEQIYEGYYYERQMGRKDGIYSNIIEDLLSKKHLKTLPDLIDHCTHNEAIHLLERVKRHRDIHDFKNSLKALIQLNEYNKTKKSTPTKVIIKLLEATFCDGEEFTGSERDKVFELISGKLKGKVAPKEIAKIHNRFFFFDEGRNKKTRYRTNFRLTNVDDLCLKFEIDEEQLLRICESMGGRFNNKKIKKVGS